jgi:hypothetical protein
LHSSLTAFLGEYQPGLDQLWESLTDMAPVYSGELRDALSSRISAGPDLREQDHVDLPLRRPQ